MNKFFSTRHTEKRRVIFCVSARAQWALGACVCDAMKIDVKNSHETHCTFLLCTAIKCIAIRQAKQKRNHFVLLGVVGRRGKKCKILFMPKCSAECNINLICSWFYHSLCSLCVCANLPFCDTHMAITTILSQLSR